MSFRFGFLGSAFIVLAACNPLNASSGPGGQSLTDNAQLLPCDVGQVLQQHCWTCHGADARTRAAPMPLVSWDDTQVMMTDTRPEGGDTQQLPVYQRMKDRINATLNSDRMPQGGSLSDSELKTLNDWIDNGAQVGQGCSSSPSNTGGGDPTANGGAGNSSGATGGSGSEVSYGGTQNYGGSSATGGSGGGEATDGGDEIPPDQCNPIDLRANDGNGGPFPVPAGTSELYQCFNFHIDLSSGNQGLSFKNLKSVADHGVIHHWLLYAMSHPVGNNTSAPCLGAHPDGALMAGWAPGAGDWVMPPDVGLDLGTGDFLLEVHFNNYGATTVDNSGVEICGAKTPRKNTASISWLGNDLFNVPGPGKWKVSGTCTPNITAPVHVFEVWPHMHKRGQSMDATITRAGTNEKVPFYNHPFDFNVQAQWPDATVINPGDMIETNCHYQTTDGFGFGEKTTDEMCFGFTVAYPAHTLVMPGANSFIHADECVATENPVAE